MDGDCHPCEWICSGLMTFLLTICSNLETILKQTKLIGHAPISSSPLELLGANSHLTPLEGYRESSRVDWAGLIERFLHLLPEIWGSTLSNILDPSSPGDPVLSLSLKAEVWDSRWSGCFWGTRPFL